MDESVRRERLAEAIEGLQANEICTYNWVRSEGNQGDCPNCGYAIDPTVDLPFVTHVHTTGFRLVDGNKRYSRLCMYSYSRTHNIIRNIGTRATQ